jgi:hypothetical protein
MTSQRQGKLVSNALGAGIILALGLRLGLGRVLGGKVTAARTAIFVIVVHGLVAVVTNAVILCGLGDL